MRTYKYRVKDKSQRKVLLEKSWMCNQIWNMCVEIQRKHQKSGEKWPSHFDLVNATKGLGKNLGVHSDTRSEICRIFVTSRNTHKKCPGFRASGGPRRKLGWIPYIPRAAKVSNGKIRYQKRDFRFWEHRKMPDKFKCGAFVEDATGRWYCTFVVEVDDLPTGSGEVGIDLGLKTVATCSDGHKIKNHRHTKRYAEKLAIAQRAGNKRRAKAIHARIKNTRRHHLHVESARIAKENKLIVVGDVSSSKLAKTKMAKSVYDAGWYALKAMLEYKASRHNARFLVVNEMFTSQTCSACGARPEQRPKGIAGLGIREWICDCGVVHDRDVNAALNILALGREHAPPAEESPGL